jgi:hypothetical protein
MNIIDHGRWIRYEPHAIPIDAPSGAMFAKRESDGVDWYDYVNSGENFAAQNVKFMAIWQDVYQSHVVGPAVYDATLLFPASQVVGEITDYTGNNPQADFGGKLYDPATGAITDPPPPEPVEDLEAMITRIVREELKRKRG